MKVVDIANEIFIEMGSQTSTSVPAIAFWVRAQVGTINTLLYEDFVIDVDTLEIRDADGEIPTEAVSIIKQMYRVYDADILIRTLTNSVLSDSILSVKDNLAGTSFTKVNKSELIKSALQSKVNEGQGLDTLVTAYRLRSAVPSQVAGDDTLAGVVHTYPTFYPLTTTRAF